MKVGLTADVAARITDFRIGNPHPIALKAYRTVPAAVARLIEKAVHTALREHAHYGEWFTCDPRHAVTIADPIIGRWRRYHDHLIRLDIETRRRARARALAEMAENNGEPTGT